MQRTNRKTHEFEHCVHCGSAMKPIAYWNSSLVAPDMPVPQSGHGVRSGPHLDGSGLVSQHNHDSALGVKGFALRDSPSASSITR